MSFHFFGAINMGLSTIKNFAFSLKERTDEHFLGLIAAGVAFYAFLSLFPAMAALISLYGLIAEPSTVESHVNAISQFIPQEMQELLSSRVRELASRQTNDLTLGLIVGIGISLWSSNKAMKAITQGLNIAYEKEEHRGFIKLNAITLGLTILSSIVALIAIAVIIALPIVVEIFLKDSGAEILSMTMSWSILICIVAILFAILYRYAPARDQRPVWRQSFPGALLATLVVILASVAFSLYVSNFGKYNEEYGAISAAVVTLLWLYITSFIFLLGAEFNGESRDLMSDLRPNI